MLKRKLACLALLVFSLGLVHARSPERPSLFQLDIPFQHLSHTGKVKLYIDVNQDPQKWGQKAFPEFKNFTPESVVGFPVCNARLEYEGKGHKTLMGWIVFQTFTDEKGTTVSPLESYGHLATKTPFVTFGHSPNYFSAPYYLGDNYLKLPGIQVQSDVFLVAPEIPNSNTFTALASFSWGFKTSLDRKVTITNPQNTNLREWKKFSEVLKRKFPELSFQ